MKSSKSEQKQGTMRQWVGNFNKSALIPLCLVGVCAGALLLSLSSCDGESIVPTVTITHPDGTVETRPDPVWSAAVLEMAARVTEVAIAEISKDDTKSPEERAAELAEMQAKLEMLKQVIAALKETGIAPTYEEITELQKPLPVEKQAVQTAKD